ncbi:CobW family GTP-binding protein [Jeotgalibacillus marinus]|uniref:GTP-binding protein n=1 Tax=Jeotgalibacillus marinus TaxID=86667 RepID=A0ABV3Q3L2_9BACL
MNKKSKKDVYILSGFLGSGKTSLLKQMIRMHKAAGKVPAVLMNELGNVSIDSSEVDQDLPLAELLDGCICCTIQDKLEAQLQELLWNEEFDTLLIETTGAAHPVEVVDAMMSPLFAEHLEFKGILTVVDAMQWVRRQELSPQVLQLYREQIRHAGVVLLNKVDLLKEMEQSTAVSELQGINKHARIIMTNYANISENVLEQISNFNQTEHDRVRIQHELSMQAIVYTFNGVIEQEAFENWMRALPSTVYRMKGYVPFSHEKYPMLFHYSFGMPVYLPEDMNMPKNLVIIGEGISKETISHDLKRLEQLKEV